MKKLLFIFALGALVLTACNKEKEIEQIPQQPTSEKAYIRAVGEAYSAQDITGETKATLNDAGTFYWAAGDQIGVRLYKGDAITGHDDVGNYDAWDATFALNNADAGKTNGEFEGPSVDEWVKAYAAWYPRYLDNDQTNIGGDAKLYFYLREWYDGYTSGTSLMPMMAFMGGNYVQSNPDAAFKHVGAGVRVTLKDVPANANQASLTVAGKNIWGWYTIDDPSQAGTASISAGDGSNSTVYLKFDTASDKRDITFIFPLPTVNLSGGITIKLYSGSEYTEFWKKSAHPTSPALPTLGRGDLLDMPELTVGDWMTLGKGKYADYWLQGIKGVIEDLWDVTVQRSIADPQQYRIVNPYGKGQNMVQTSTHDDYLYFTINESTGAVTFTDHITGVLHNGGDQNYKLKYAETDKNMIVLGDKDTPKVLQFSPDYVNANNESWSWPRKGLPYMIRLVMPDYVSAYSSDVTVTSDASLRALLLRLASIFLLNLIRVTLRLIRPLRQIRLLFLAFTGQTKLMGTILNTAVQI